MIDKLSLCSILFPLCAFGGSLRCRFHAASGSFFLFGNLSAAEGPSATAEELMGGGGGPGARFIALLNRRRNPWQYTVAVAGSSSKLLWRPPPPLCGCLRQNCRKPPRLWAHVIVCKYIWVYEGKKIELKRKEEKITSPENVTHSGSTATTNFFLCAIMLDFYTIISHSFSPTRVLYTILYTYRLHSESPIPSYV